METLAFGSLVEPPRGDCKRAAVSYGSGIDAKNKDDLTPLALASSKGQLEVARLFLERGANVEASAIL